MRLPLFSRRGQADRSSRRVRWLLLVGLVGAAACEEDQVRFGPPNNLRLRDSKSIDPCPNPPGATGETCPEWETEVFPILDSDKVGCTAIGCHSEESPSKGLALYKGDAAKSYEAMSKYVNAAGRPYLKDVDDQDPDKPPYLICNLTANPLVGSRMPLGDPMSKEDLVVLGNWALCGMKQAGGTPVMPGAGGGGAGP